MYNILNWRFFRRKKKRNVKENNNVSLKIKEISSKKEPEIQRGWQHRWKRWFPKFSLFKKREQTLYLYESL